MSDYPTGESPRRPVRERLPVNTSQRCKLVAGISDRRRSITASAVNDAAHTALGIIAIAVSPGDKMDMGVKYGLAGGSANIGADVESGHSRIVSLDGVRKGANQGLAVTKLRFGHGEPVSGMTPRHDQQMPLGNWEPIIEGDHCPKRFNRFSLRDPSTKEAIWIGFDSSVHDN